MFCLEYLVKQIKNSANSMINIYVKLFNKVLDTGVVLDDWASGHLKAVYGKHKHPYNYQPISLFRCLDKLCTSILND